MNTTKEDTLIILGDAGINYYGPDRDRALKQELAALPITLFCIHGNHEQRPERIATYELLDWHEGLVYAEPDFPSLLFARDGELYRLAGKRCIAIGGAYSIDKPFRLCCGWEWWEDEQPSEEVKRGVEAALDASDWKVDAVFSHTCPIRYEPREDFLPGLDQQDVDKSTELWLDAVAERLSCADWYCGHFHVDKTVDRLHFLYESFLSLGE